MTLTLTATSISSLSLRLPLFLSLYLAPTNPTLLKPSCSRFCSIRFAMPPSTIVAEYAKSKRSTCKTCSTAILANALRLGVVTKDTQRGFDMTRWHHLHCLSFDSVSVSSLGSIKGFDLLQSDDQDALKKLMDKCEKVKDEDENVGAGEQQKNTKKLKVKGKDENVGGREQQKNTKKLKLSESENVKVEIALAASDVKDNYKEATLPSKWKSFHTVIFLEKDDGLQDATKIAAFDFDGCLAKTSVKRIGADAWSLMYPSIPEKLQKLYADGFKLVIFTNESNIDRWKNKRQTAVDSKIGRLNNFIKLVNTPMQVFIACGFDKSGAKDPYRKPQAGMWHAMEKNFNSGLTVDMDQSFYVGDAAGRGNDHSDADMKFAQAIGLKFYLPEEFFAV